MSLDTLKVVVKGKYAPEFHDGSLLISVEGDSVTDLMSPDAKRLAYNAGVDRDDFNTGGIERWRVPFLVEGKAKKQRFVTIFKLTAGLPTSKARRL